MHSSRMKKLLDAHNIDFKEVYSRTEKVKLLDGTIRHLKDVIKKPKNNPNEYSGCEDIPLPEIEVEIGEILTQETSGRLEIPEPHKESLVPFEVIEVVDNNPEKHIETEVIKKPSKKHK